MEPDIVLSRETLTVWLGLATTASRFIGILDAEIVGQGTATEDALHAIDDLGRKIAEILGVVHPFGRARSHHDTLPWPDHTTMPAPMIDTEPPLTDEYRDDEPVTRNERPSQRVIRTREPGR